MKVGDLVKRSDDHFNRGIVMEITPEPPSPDRGDHCCGVRWLDGDYSYEAVRLLEVVSEGR